ncbi:MAG: hypothetical protein QXO35_00350 [Candidatus Micrarchaeia archaeon]
MLILFQLAMQKPEQKLTAEKLFDNAKLKNLENNERNALEKLIQQMSYVNNKDFTDSVRKFFKSNKGEIKFTGIFTASELDNLEKALNKLGYKFEFSIIPNDDEQIQKWYKYTNKDPALDIKNFINFMNGGSVEFELSTSKISKESNEGMDGTLQVMNINITTIQKNIDNIQEDLKGIKKKYNDTSSTQVEQSKSEGKKEEEEVREQKSDETLQKALDQIGNIQVKIGGKQTRINEISSAKSKLKKLEQGLNEGESVSFTMNPNLVMMNNLKEIAKYWAGKDVKEEQISENKFVYTGEGGSYEVKYEKGQYIITHLQSIQKKEPKQEITNVFSMELIINGINFNKPDTDGKHKVQKLLEGKEVEYNYKDFPKIKDAFLAEINNRTGRTYKYAAGYPKQVGTTNKYIVKLELVSDEKSNSSSTQPPEGMQKPTETSKQEKKGSTTKETKEDILNNLLTEINKSENLTQTVANIQSGLRISVSAGEITKDDAIWIANELNKKISERDSKLKITIL